MERRGGDTIVVTLQHAGCGWVPSYVAPWHHPLIEDRWDRAMTRRKALRVARRAILREQHQHRTHYRVLYEERH